VGLVLDEPKAEDRVEEVDGLKFVLDGELVSGLGQYCPSRWTTTTASGSACGSGSRARPRAARTERFAGPSHAKQSESQARSEEGAYREI